MEYKKFLLTLNSNTTIKQYRSVLELYKTFTEEKCLQWDSIDSVVEYMIYLKSCSVALNTLKNRLACIKAFLQWHGINCEEFPIIRGDNYVPTEGLSNEEAVAIIDAIPSEEVMHNALLSLLLFTGIRRSEACSIRILNIKDVDKCKVITIIGKGNKIRQIPLQQSIVDKINILIRALVYGDESFIFSLDKGKTPIHPNTIYNLVKKYSKKAGINKKISPHSFRVTAVTNAISNGSNLLEVKEFGGWNSLEMVMRYDRNHKMLKNSAAWKINYRR